MQNFLFKEVNFLGEMAVKKEIFNFKDWAVDATEHFTKLINIYRQTNEANHKNAFYSKNAVQLDQASQILYQALTTLKQDADTANYVLEESEKVTIAVIELVEKFHQINDQIINQLRSVYLDQKQLAELSSRYKNQNMADIDADKIFALEEQYSMEAVGSLYAIPDEIEGINYKITVIGYNIDNLKNGNHFDYLGVVIPDNYFINNYQVNLSDMIKYPTDNVLDNARDRIAAGEPNNDPVTFTNETAQDGQNSLDEIKISFQSQASSVGEQTQQDLMGDVNHSTETALFVLPISF